jgi:glycosyltransferase involved in cell wall biosynthesis
MKVLYFATYYTRHYVRQSVIRSYLKTTPGIEVVECIYNKKGWSRYVCALWKFFWLNKRDIDVVVVGFRGQEMVPLVHLMTKKPIVFDAFLSIFDTLCNDRKKFSPHSVLGRAAYWLDKKDCQIADHIILDTQAHITYFAQTFSIPQEKFSRIFVGANDKLFYPRVTLDHPEAFTVFYYGTVLPLQGIDVILQAALILKDELGVKFRLIGPIRNAYRAWLDEHHLQNVVFADWVPYHQLPEEIALADCCLGGHFAENPKALRVIAGKAFQFIAMKKPVIIGASKATKELFNDRENCYMVPVGDPQSLARAILALQHDQPLREKISENGYKLFLQTQDHDRSRMGEIIRSYATK